MSSANRSQETVLAVEEVDSTEEYERSVVEEEEVAERTAVLDYLDQFEPMA